MISFDKDKCNGCGVCVNVCPQGVIALNDKKAKMVDYESCMECGACQLNCQQNAIELTKGTGCLFAIVREDILKIAPRGRGAGCGCADENSKGACC